VSLMPYTIAASWSVRLVTQGRERHIVWATALSLILAFTLNYWLIPSYGSIGTALTVVGSESLLAAALLIARR
jgi:O-antigen/teichoic acid export membrane protein